MQNDNTYAALAFAGAIPFVACALLPFLDVVALPRIGPLDTFAGLYGLAILSFVAGTHWAFQLMRPSATPFNLFVASNTVFLLVFFTWVLAPKNWALVSQAIAFAFLLLVDRKLSAAAVTSNSYLRVRAIASTAAFVSLLTIAGIYP